MTDTTHLLYKEIERIGFLNLYGWSLEDLVEMEDEELEKLTFFVEADDPGFPRIAVHDDCDPKILQGKILPTWIPTVIA